MRIQPIYIALFIFSVLAFLFGLMFLSEEAAIKNEQSRDDGFAYGITSIKYPTYETFLGIESNDSALSRADILKVTDIVNPLDIEEEGQEEEVAVEEEEDEEISTEEKIKELPDFSKIDTTQLVRIRYPDSNPDFVAELRRKLSSKNCRILHYGDSQIEGDRITAYLRNRLQKMYKGSGPGFIPVKPVYRQVSAIVEPTENWERYAFFDHTQKRFNHRKYGTYLSFSKFTEFRKGIPDSTELDTMPVVRASVTLGKSKRTYKKFRTFSHIGLHYGNCLVPNKIKVYNDDVLVQEDSLIQDGKYHKYKIKLPKTPTNLRIDFESKLSADFYGFTLDGGRGVQVDNIAMRGASGTIFTATTSKTYSAMTKELDPKIVIMQYGGNTMPYLKDSTDVEKYTKRIKNQINWMRRRASQKISFIFIGPTDMCQPVNGKMETYPLLPYLNQRLLETCLENNVAYWSMFHAMGGKGSMPLWVDEELTARDYMHFTWKGTKIISELFFTALYLDLKQKDNEV